MREDPFGKVLKKCRSGRGLTRAEMAKHLGVADTYYSRIETGKQSISIKRVYAWSLLLGQNSVNFVSAAFKSRMRNELRKVGLAECLRVQVFAYKTFEEYPRDNHLLSG